MGRGGLGWVWEREGRMRRGALERDMVRGGLFGFWGWREECG